MLPSSSNNGHLFSASWIDGVRERAAARDDAGKVERMERMSREMNRRDSDADRMLVYAEALAAAEESERETRKEVEQAEARARVAMRAEANACADARRERAGAKRAIIRAEEGVKEAVCELRVAVCIQKDPLYKLGHYCRLLENTQAVLIVRDQVTKHLNDTLWQDYARDELSSPFVVMDEAIPEEELTHIKKEMSRWAKRRKDNIAVQLTAQMIDCKITSDNDDDAVGLMTTIEEADMEEVMINAASTAAFVDWHSSVFSPCVVRELIHSKYEGEPKHDKENREVRLPHKLLTTLQHLACWLVYAYNELGSAEEGSMLFTDYYNRRFQTSTCRNASGLIVAALVIPDILGMCACTAVTVAGTTPFYLEARFVKRHDGWAHFWRDWLVPNGTDSAKDKGQKERNARLFNLLVHENISGTKTEIIRKVTTTWSDRATLTQGMTTQKKAKQDNAYPAYNAFVKLCSHLGLKIMSTGTDRRPWKGEETGGKMKTGFRISLRKHDFAMMFLLKKRIVHRVRTMLGELVHTYNLSDSAKDFVRDAVVAHNAAVDHMVREPDPNDPVDELTVPISQARANTLRISLAAPINADEIPVIQERYREIGRLDRLLIEQDDHEMRDTGRPAPVLDHETQPAMPSQANPTDQDNRLHCRTTTRVNSDEGETEWLDEEDATMTNSLCTDVTGMTTDTGITCIRRGGRHGLKKSRIG